jgi:hypothetical protein
MNARGSASPRPDLAPAKPRVGGRWLGWTFRGTPRILLAALIVVGLEASACDKLLKKDDATADNDDDDTPKKKKKKKKSDDDDEAPSAEPSASAVATAEPTASATAEPSAVASAEPSASASATAAYSGEATRYPDETQLPDEKRKIRNVVAARKETDHVSEVVVTLQPGNEVDQVAERHEFTLVTWKNKSGDHYGWVDTLQAFQDRSIATTPVPQVSAIPAASAHPPDIAGLARPTAPLKPPPAPPVLRRPGLK